MADSNPNNVAKPALFNANKLIQELGKEPAWTISDVDKRPLDVRHFLQTGTFDRLAKPTNDWNPLVTLPEINANEKLKLTNRAYHLNARQNNIICIDIEPTASEEERQLLLQLPFEYLEYSTHMGFHGLLRLDPKYLNVLTEMILDVVNIKLPSRTWEVILNDHYCTFTQNVIEPVQMDEQTKDTMMKNFINYLIKIDAKNNEARTKAIAASDMSEELSEHLLEVAKLFPESDFEYIRKISPDNYIDDAGKPDVSKYEFNICRIIRKQLAQRIEYGFEDPFSSLTIPKGPAELTDKDYVELVYYFAKQILPYRDKHDTIHSGYPYLLYICRTLGSISNDEMQTIKKNAKYSPQFMNKWKYEKFYS